FYARRPSISGQHVAELPDGERELAPSRAWQPGWPARSCSPSTCCSRSLSRYQAGLSSYGSLQPLLPTCIRTPLAPMTGSRHLLSISPSIAPVDTTLWLSLTTCRGRTRPAPSFDPRATASRPKSCRVWKYPLGLRKVKKDIFWYSENFPIRSFHITTVNL